MQRLIVALGDDGVISPENMAMLRLLCTEYEAKRKHYYKPRRFRSLEEFGDEECKHLFMFDSQADIRELMQGFQIPDRFKLSNGSYVSGEEAFLILLMRFVYPGRWCQHMETFGGSAGFHSESFYLVLNHIQFELRGQTLGRPCTLRAFVS